MKFRKLLAAAAAAAVAVSTMALSAFAADIWTGSNDLGTDWNGDNALKIDASSFADTKDGDTVTIEYTTNEDSGMSLKIVENTNGWPPLSSPKDLDPQWETVYVEKGTTSYSFVISAEDVTRIQTSGMVIQGAGVTLTKVAVGGAAAADTTADDQAAPAAGDSDDLDDADADIVDTNDDADEDVADGTAASDDTTVVDNSASVAPAADTTTAAAATGNVAVASIAAVMAAAGAAAIVSKKRK